MCGDCLFRPRQIAKTYGIPTTIFCSMRVASKGLLVLSSMHSDSLSYLYVECYKLPYAFCIVRSSVVDGCNIIFVKRNVIEPSMGVDRVIKRYVC